MALDHRMVVKIIARGLVVLAGCLVLWKQWLTRLHATASVHSDRSVGVGFDLTESYGSGLLYYRCCSVLLHHSILCTISGW